MARRRAGRLALACLLLGLAAVAALWVVPSCMNWSRYRGTLAAFAAAALGQPVRIEGKVSLVLLPEPVLTASGIAVAHTRAQGGGTLAVKEVRLRVDPLSLLSGHVDARELVLRGPDLTLPWPLPHGAVSLRPPAWLTALSARIEDGHLQLGGLSISAIEASLRTAETGTLVGEGSATVYGSVWHFTARVSRPGGDGAAGLEVTLAGQGALAKTGARFSGQVSADGSLTGRVGAWGPDLGLLIPAPVSPFTAEGRLNAAGGLAIADDLAVMLGGLPARGAVALRVAPAPRLDLALTASRLDLDTWLPVLLGARSASLGMPLGLDLSAEAATVAGSTWRRVRGAFDLTDAGIQVREASATLPGDAALRLDGLVTQAARRPATEARPAAFAGRVRLAAPDLHATLQWLRTVAPLLPLAPPAEVLRSADVVADVTAEPDRVALANLAGTLDGQAVSGGLSLRLGGVRPVLGAGLVFDRLKLDPWLPARLPPLAGIPASLSPADGDLRVQARKATLRGMVIGDLAFDASVEAGRLTVRQLEGVAQGVRMTASGVLGEDARLSQGHLELSSGEAERLAPLLPASWQALWPTGPPPLLAGPFTLQLQAEGPPQALAVRAAASLGDARLEATPTLDLPAGSWAGALTLHHPGASRFLQESGLPAVLGLPTPLDWLGDGSLSLALQLSARPGRLASEHVELIAGALHGDGQFVLDQAQGRPRLSARLSAETLPLPWPYPHGADPLPLALLQGWVGEVRLQAKQVLVGARAVLQDAAATLRLADRRLSLDPFTARAGGGALTGAVSLDAAREPPTLTLHVALVAARLDTKLSDFPIDLACGTLGGSADLTASGHSPATLLATLAGRLQVTVHAGTLDGIDLPALRAIADAPVAAPRTQVEDAVRAALSGGTTAFEVLDLPMRAAGGTLALDGATLTRPDIAASVSGTLDLTSETLDLRLGLHPVMPDPPEIGLRLTGPMAAPRRVPELAGIDRWLAERRIGR